MSHRSSKPAFCAASKDGLRLLGDGEIKSKITITVNHASAKAKAAVEKAGGTVNVIEVKVLEADEARSAPSRQPRRPPSEQEAGAAKAEE